MCDITKNVFETISVYFKYVSIISENYGVRKDVKCDIEFVSAF